MQSTFLGNGTRHASIARLISGQLRSRSEQAEVFRRLGAELTEPYLRSDFIDDMTRAEIIGEMSEFHALFLRAILAMREGLDSERVHDYLDMAEIATIWPHEHAAIAEARARYDAQPIDLRALVARCVASLDLTCDICGRIAA